MFIIGLIIGLVLFPLVNYFWKEDKVKIPQPQKEKEIITEEKTIRDYYINLTHYTPDQLKKVYDLLRELQEPLSCSGNHKNWWEEGYDPNMHGQLYTFDYLGFGHASWIVLVKYEIRNRQQIELQKFLELLQVERTKLNEHERIGI